MEVKGPLLSGAASLLARRSGTGKTATLHALAAAEAASRGRVHSLCEVIAFIKQLLRSGICKPRLFVEHSMYDETPLRLRTFDQNGLCATALNKKAFVIKVGWAALLEFSSFIKEEQEAEDTKSEFLLLRGAFCPSIRPAASTCGECVSELSMSCPHAETSSQLFDHYLRIAETDDHGGNRRGEKILAQKLQRSSRQWSHLHMMCKGHKLHAAAVRCWHLQPSLLAGLIHSGKMLQESNGLQELNVAIMKVVDARLRVFTPAEFRESVAMADYKAQILRMYSPPSSQPRRLATVKLTTSLLNGDWQDSVWLQHVCHSCCPSREASVRKIALTLQRLVTSVRGSVLSRSNWMTWRQSCNLCGLGLGIHRFLSHAFKEAFAATDEVPRARLEVNEPEQQQEPEGQASMDQNQPDTMDDEVRYRMERAKSRRTALQFVLAPNALEELMLMSTALLPQHGLMVKLLHELGEEADMQRYSAFVEGRKGRYICQWLHEGIDMSQALIQTQESFNDSKLWTHIDETEYARSHIARVLFRPAACIFQLLLLPAEQLPNTLFGLLSAETEVEKQRLAEEILLTPMCLRDRFSRSFLARWSTEQLLTSRVALEELGTIAAILRMTTYEVERLHSVNPRKAQTRVQTHRVDAKTLGARQQAWSGPSHLRPREAEKQSGGPRGRPRKRPLAQQTSTQAPSKKKRRRGGGGAWRCFVNHRNAGRPLTSQTQRSLSEAYWSLSPEEFRVYETLGRAGALGKPDQPCAERSRTALSRNLSSLVLSNPPQKKTQWPLASKAYAAFCTTTS